MKQHSKPNRSLYPWYHVFCYFLLKSNVFVIVTFRFAHISLLQTLYEVMSAYAESRRSVTKTMGIRPQTTTKGSPLDDNKNIPHQPPSPGRLPRRWASFKRLFEGTQEVTGLVVPVNSLCSLLRNSATIWPKQPQCHHSGDNEPHAMPSCPRKLAPQILFHPVSIT